MKYEIEDILSAVCTYTNFTQKDLRTPSRKGKLVTARQYFMYLAYEYTIYAYEKIGWVVNRDHATVLHAYRKYSEGYVPRSEQEDLENILTILGRYTEKAEDQMLDQLGKAYYFANKSMDLLLGIEKLSTAPSVYKKICYVCNEEKESVFFNKDKNRKDGLHPICKKCRKEKYKSRKQ